jgi:hypothetical protein
MDIQASRVGHCVQTKDVGGILWKQKKSEEERFEVFVVATMNIIDASFTLASLHHMNAGSCLHIQG